MEVVACWDDFVSGLLPGRPPTGHSQQMQFYRFPMYVPNLYPAVLVGDWQDKFRVTAQRSGLFAGSRAALDFIPFIDLVKSSW